MMRPLLCAVLALAFCTAAHAQVVRPAPDFAISGVAQGTSLKSFRGQAVVLVVTQRSRGKEFRAMLSRLHDVYSEFSNEKVIFVAAIEDGGTEVPCDIPFLLASDPAQVAADYGVTGRFAVAVIGTDGNLDFITQRLVAAERVRDMVFDNYESQSASRKQPL
jgi:peroxiredoxin